MKRFTKEEIHQLNDVAFQSLGDTGRYPTVTLETGGKFEFCGIECDVADTMYYIVMQPVGNEDEAAVTYRPILIKGNMVINNLHIHGAIARLIN